MSLPGLIDQLPSNTTDIRPDESESNKSTSNVDSARDIGVSNYTVKRAAVSKPEFAMTQNVIHT